MFKIKKEFCDAIRSPRVEISVEIRSLNEPVAQGIYNDLKKL